MRQIPYLPAKTGTTPIFDILNSLWTLGRDVGIYPQRMGIFSDLERFRNEINTRFRSEVLPKEIEA